MSGRQVACKWENPLTFYIFQLEIHILPSISCLLIFPAEVPASDFDLLI